MNQSLYETFLKFKLESFASQIADALGVEAIPDFFDLDASQILKCSKNLGLKPVTETRLVRLHRFVLETCAPHDYTLSIDRSAAEPIDDSHLDVAAIADSHSQVKKMRQLKFDSGFLTHSLQEDNEDNDERGVEAASEARQGVLDMPVTIKLSRVLSSADKLATRFPAILEVEDILRAIASRELSRNRKAIYPLFFMMSTKQP
jgi:hypothetical protein